MSGLLGGGLRRVAGCLRATQCILPVLVIAPKGWQEGVAGLCALS